MAGVFDLLERFYGGKARSIVKLRAFVDWLGQQVPDDLSDPWAHVLHRPQVSIVSTTTSAGAMRSSSGDRGPFPWATPERAEAGL